MKLRIPAACDDRTVDIDFSPPPETTESIRIREATVSEVLATTRVLTDALVRLADTVHPTAPATAQHCVRLAGTLSRTVLEAVANWPT